MKFVSKAEKKETGVFIKYPDRVFKQKIEKLLEDSEEKTGGYISVNLDKVYRPRTIGVGSQNNLIWKLIAVIAEAVGDDSPKMIDTENGIKDRAISRGYPTRLNKFTKKLEPKSMTEINTVECSYLIDTAYQIISELGIVLPPQLIQGVRNE